MNTNGLQSETTEVKTQVLNKLLELSEAMLQGHHTGRVITDFDDELITKIADNLNRFADKLELGNIGQDYNQEETVNTFIEVISSFANLDFKQKLTISERGTIMDAIATGINVLGDELERSTASKQELEVERNRLNEAQAIAKLGNWQLDTSSLHLTWSKEASRIFELEDMSGDNLYEAFRKKVHPEDLPKIDHLIKEAVEKGKGFVLEHRMICNDSTIKYIRCIGEVVDHSKTNGVLLKGTTQDITESKTVEKALKKAKEYAEEANSAKSQFLANMSHEIRTPLNGILGLTQVMLGDEITETHRGYLETINNSGKNLSHLINDILDFSKIESGKLHLENMTFNFKEVISSNINPYKFLAKQKNLELSYYIEESMPVEVIGDPTRIAQVLTNLIGNAIKFTDKGKIEIIFSLIDTTDKEAVIRGVIRDTGIGIPKGKLDTIFSSFTQADETVTRKYGGTGLGLSIVKSLVIQMNGDISVNSPADPLTNRGSVFTFSIKLKLPDKQIAPESPVKSEAKKLRFEKPFHILIVDDNPVNLLVAELFVKKFGGKVTTAQNGNESINRIKEAPDQYDIVLMDIQMPGMDGYQTTIELRKLKYTLPIIALSANAYSDDVQSCLNSGMNDHLQKPYTEEKLFQKIMKFVTR